jgi:replication fork clamp-binding protein CrfC
VGKHLKLKVLNKGGKHMKEESKIIAANKKISKKGKMHSESNDFTTSANKANSLINEEFYHSERKSTGISPALILNNAPLVDTNDQYIAENEER